MILRIALMAIAVPVVGWFGPWWGGFVAVAAIEAFLGHKGGYPFLTGFYGVALPWLTMALVADVANGQQLSHMIQQLFHLPRIPYLMVVLTGLLGGLLGGWMAYTVSLLKQWNASRMA